MFNLKSSVALPLAVALVGCNTSSTPSAQKESQPAAGQVTDDQQDDDHEDHLGDTKPSERDPAVAEALSELSAEERSLAEKQGICPVTDELLGSMGAPIKVDIDGTPVFICCEGCREELLKNPKEYLAKLKM